MFSYKKTLNPKKKVISARNLEDCLPSLPLKTRKAKNENQIFYRDSFVLLFIFERTTVFFLKILERTNVLLFLGTKGIAGV